MRHQGWVMPLFVPATRPERFAKAAASGADAIILDLEDAVDPSDKSEARRNVAKSIGLGSDVILRINATGTQWHDEDLRAGREAGVQAIMLAKAERVEDLARAHQATGLPVIALIETLAALDQLGALAAAPGVIQMAFGTMDMAAELGCTPMSSVMAPIRLQILAASVRAGIAAPLEGVSLLLTEADVLQKEAAAIAANGFAGRLLIHPAQIEPTAKGLAPTFEELTLARKIGASTGAAVRVEGRMVDRPVRLNAERLIARAAQIAATLAKADPNAPHREIKHV